MTPLSPVARRRTFAIISHPDAGKTTLTEKMLLYGGAIQLAGEVRAKANRRQTRSDWMGIERERGISVVTSVMTFEFEGIVFNLLDTPGHEDFSEDTYRTLTAVDSALMVIDCAKGVEERTIEVARSSRLFFLLDTLEYLVHETKVWTEITTLLNAPFRNSFGSTETGSPPASSTMSG